MLLTLDIDPSKPDRAAEAILEGWAHNEVLHLRARSLHPDQVQPFYDRLIPRIGTAHYLAEDVRLGTRGSQRSGEMWMEVRYDPAFTDAYRHSANAQPLHTDGSYIPSFPNASLMCCVRNAGVGGETTFITAEALIEGLRSEEPELLELLQSIPMPHARSGDALTWPVVRRDAEGTPRVNWNYYCVSSEADPAAQRLRERLFAYLRDSPAVAAAIVPVKLETGDAVVWKDDRLLHGRNAFGASVASERFLWKCCLDVGVFAGTDAR